MNQQDFSMLPYFVGAGFSGLWVITHEAEAAQSQIITSLSTKEEETTYFYSWDCIQGCRQVATEKPTPHDPKSTSPLWPLTLLQPDHARQIIFLHNYHKFLENPQVIQALHNAIYRGKSQGTHYVILTSSVSIPQELSKDFAVFSHPLPTDTELLYIADNLIPTGQDWIMPAGLIDAARGMTRTLAENALALSLATRGAFDPALISDLKARSIASSGVLSLEQPRDSFANLAGLTGAKDLILRATQPNPQGVRAKGALIVGIPGAGKSHLARASAAATSRPLFRLDVGRLLHKHVGESEANLREAISIIEAVGRSLVFIDEGEKAFAGASSGDGDSGVMRRLFGTLLTWMEERTCDAFILFTSNDVSQLPPEFLRAGRWSFEIFVDLPTLQERQAIWDLYLKKYLIPDEPSFSHDGWTGGEICACCELAALLQIPLADASRKVRITSKARPEQVKALRTYATQAGCLCATTGEPYQLPATTPTQPLPSRKVSTKGKLDIPPSNN